MRRKMIFAVSYLQIELYECSDVAFDLWTKYISSAKKIVTKMK